MKRRMLLCLFMFGVTFFPLFAGEPAFKALLVSIEKYEYAPLDFAGQDMAKLGAVLSYRYGCVIESSLDRTGSDSKKTPMKSVEEKIKTWCKSLSSGDMALLYLSGHGVKDSDGKLYLAMIDFDGKNFDTAAIPLETIRTHLGECKGKSKLLLIDTCFSGTSKSFDFDQATTGEISDVFKGLSSVATIASCGENEKSWLWTEMKHSLFTYWLIEAFKGHALDDERKLTFGGLAKYLQEKVPSAANLAVEQPQHPVVLNPEAGKDFQLPIHAIFLQELIDDIAEQIDAMMRMKKYTQIGVPEFTTGAERAFDPAYGTLPRWVSEQLRERLVRKSDMNRSGYTVVSENALREILAENNIGPENLGGKMTQKINIDGTELPILLAGNIELFGDGGVMLKGKLLDTQGMNDVGVEAKGTAFLRPKEIAMTKASFKVPDKFIISPPHPLATDVQRTSVENVGNVPVRFVEEAEAIHEEQEKPHPLQDRELQKKFDIWFEVRNSRNVRYQKRNVQFDGNNCYLALSQGEEFRIMIQNKTPDEVFARVLVDGLNTLSQKQTVQAKGAILEEVESATYVLAPRASLDDARPWVLFPPPSPRQLTTCPIEGFYDANFKNDTLHPFTIVDADKSVIDRRDYTEQLGYITIGFFQAEPKSRGFGENVIDPGPGKPTKVEKYIGNNNPGEMIAVYNIRYMTPAALESLLRKTP